MYGPSQARSMTAGQELRSIPVDSFFRGLAGFQGAYFIVTGTWPLLSMRTFIMVTGEKTDHLVTGREQDHWLVLTVGVLVLAIGLALAVASWRGRFTPEIAVLAIASSLSLIGIDVVYVSRDVIAPIYLADAAVEVVLAFGWFALVVARTVHRA